MPEAPDPAVRQAGATADQVSGAADELAHLQHRHASLQTDLARARAETAAAERSLALVTPLRRHLVRTARGRVGAADRAIRTRLAGPALFTPGVPDVPGDQPEIKTGRLLASIQRADLATLVSLTSSPPQPAGLRVYLTVSRWGGRAALRVLRGAHRRLRLVRGRR